MMRISEKRRTLRKFLCASVMSFQLINDVFAQSNPGLYYGFVPTPGQWNFYFSGKADYPGVFGQSNSWTNINTFSGLVNFGINGINGGTIDIFGSTSGELILTTQANAGTWKWIFPNSLGVQGTYLQSSGPNGVPQTWGQPFYVNAASAQGVNLNSVGDTQINLNLPTTSYILIGVSVINTGTATAFATGNFSLCSLAGAGGTCVVPSTAFSGITSAGANKTHNMEAITVQNFYSNIQTWFFRVGTPTGFTATATVLISVRPLPQGYP